jgi:YVTN family beta-propeller protein
MKYLTKSNICAEIQKPFLRPGNLFIAMVETAVLIIGSSVGQAQTTQVSAPPRSGLVNAMATAFSPSTHKAYTVDSEEDSVIVTDDASNSIHTVKVGAAPVSIGVNSINGLVYVANAGDGTVSVIDGKTDAVIATLPIGAHPYSIAVDSARGKVYVTRTYSDDLMEIDGATNAVTGIKAGSPDLIAIDPRSHSIYLLGYEGGNLTILDGKTHEPAKNSVGMHAWGMALNGETGALYVAKTGDAGVAVVDSPLANSRLIPTGRIPCAVGINSRTNTIYAVNYEDDSVSVIDGKSSHAIATLTVGKRPQAIAVDTIHNLVYVANTQGKSVTVIDGANNKTLASIPAGNAPYALAIDAVAGKLHVANLDRNAFTTLDVSHFQH